MDVCVCVCMCVLTAKESLKLQADIFVTASHQTGLDTTSMTRKSIKVRIRGWEGRARAEARVLPDYDAAHPPEGGSAEAEGLMASSLPLLNSARTNGRGYLSYDPPSVQIWHKVVFR